MKRIKINMSFNIRADEDDEDAIREAVHEHLQEVLELEEVEFSIEDEEHDFDDEEA